MRGARIPVGARARVVSKEPRIYLRVPVATDEREFTELMRASHAFHKPWATAPVDQHSFAAYVVDTRRPDFEGLLACRYSDDAIVGFFNLSQIARGSTRSSVGWRPTPTSSS